MEGVGEGMRSVWEYFENTVLNYVNISHNQEIKLYQQGWKIVKTEFKQKQTDVSVSNWSYNEMEENKKELMQETIDYRTITIYC